MDLSQIDHLKAYGVAYRCLERGQEVEWLLNYRGGSFLIEETETNRRDLLVEGVGFEPCSGSQAAQIYATIEENNMELVLLEKAPKVAVYIPPIAEPWDDAVTLALTYAKIPYDQIWDEEVLSGKLSRYDWLHLHHEDFTGQYGKFYSAYHTAKWYRDRQTLYEERALAAGYPKVWQHKHAVAAAIKQYIAQGGFLFAMCSACDTFDIALAAGNVDIVDRVYDGDAPDPGCQSKLDFSRGLIFENFLLEMNPMVYEYSNIDMSDYSALRGPQADYFTLFDFSAKEDPVPTMLTQCHVNVINGFMGQTTNFNRKCLKPSGIILAEVEGTDEVRYVHGNYGQGTVTFYGGHDPEDYQHKVGDPPTRLDLHKDSPGYRLILNNILFPAAQKKERKT
ncbi:MAG: asparagine synthetase B [Candidatus Eisenbacteria bacterium]|uniref:Asparagine synthetase B n=1 Tax=Eiseniibacteriota bacterium TaxID=2212470 RepID=A0A948WAU6_UNCEI|nr:asparagine synthetase B [Candidatus Eisenbacteria bacterium]MBU1948622.1 asparagine synthetase B [Candidatus Eisenbacteria bacterium]MBU2689378.1 asparagine synthetase B [Candidatus Eisenbacteria bacterium]